MRLKSNSFRTLAIAGLLAAVPPMAAAQNLMNVSITEPGSTGVSQTIRLGLNKSTVIDLQRPAADVVITNPEIADAVVQTASRIIFRGVQTGQTNAYIFDRNNNQLLNLEITVDVDTASLEQIIARYVPDARVAIESVAGSYVVTGEVDSLVQSDQVLRLVAAYSGQDEPKIVNMMGIAAKDQVMLEVRIVEMQRSVVKQLGVNLDGATANFGDLARLVNGVPTPPYTNNVTGTVTNRFNVAGQAIGGLNTSASYTNYDGDVFQSSVAATLDAMERVGIVRTLAEPNIMAVSGESANFLAGGEFPVPVGQDNNGNITVEFKPFGVGLAFTPVVLSEGRISLKISTEVSELSNQGAFQGQSVAGVTPEGQPIVAQTISVPSLVVRRAESTVELPSGGSTMLAGLIQSRTRQTLDQLPGIKKLPILGALFQSRDFLNEETELVVIVTPYLVDPTSKDELKTPADGFVSPTDLQTIFFGKLNAVYAGEDGEELSADRYRAPVGFIEE